VEDTLVHTIGSIETSDSGVLPAGVYGSTLESYDDPLGLIFKSNTYLMTLMKRNVFMFANSKGTDLR
jgi:hypothetical protein